MKKSVKKYQPGGLVDTDGNPVRDGSGNPIMTGSFPDEDEITARGRAQNAAMFKSLFNRVTGRGKETPEAASSGPAAGTSSLRDPQQMAEQKAALKFSDGDVDERDRRMEAAASAPSRVPTRPNQNTPKASVAKAPVSKPSSVGSAAMNDEARKRQSATKNRSANYSNEGRSTAKKSADNYSNEGRGRPAPVEKKKELGPLAAGRYSPGYAKQLEQTEQKRIGRLEAERIRDAEKNAKRESEFGKFNEAMKSDPKQKELKAAKEKKEKMSPAERSAARGKAIKEFFGMAKGGSVSSASKRADGIAQRGKTRGRMY